MNPRIRPGSYAPGREQLRHRTGDGTEEFTRAGSDLHHLVLGPGADLLADWEAQGLQLPDIAAIRSYRLSRVRQALDDSGYDGILVMDPLNIRYLTDTTNMQVWVMHNAARYCFLSADGYLVLWDYHNCEFLSSHNPHIDEVRPAIGSTYLYAGHRYAEIAGRWADDLCAALADIVGPDSSIAVDQVNYLEGTLLAERGLTIGRGQEVMEQARSVKSSDELDAMRCAGAACVATMAEMREQVAPGMTEREVWAILHAGNIRRGGEWIETQILASGPRTNPWFQEASSRPLENGDILAYDTDLIGAYGMCLDISRSWIVGDARPSAAQRHVHGLALEQIHHNTELVRAGVTLEELTRQAWSPNADDYRRYSVLYHGVGLCDEWPTVYFPEQWDEWGHHATLESGMVLAVEAYVGPRAGGEGIKLEQQVVVTHDGCELIVDFPLDL